MRTTGAMSGRVAYTHDDKMPMLAQRDQLAPGGEFHFTMTRIRLATLKALESVASAKKRHRERPVS